MFEEIINFLNDRPLVGILIIVIIIYLLIDSHMTCNKKISCNKNEHLDGTVTNQTYLLNNDDKFNESYVGPTKTVNFKCTINNVDYYLANMKTTECTNITLGPTECTDAVMLLVNVDDINQMLVDYLKKININEQKCISNRKIDCINTASNDTDKKKCDIDEPSCKETRMFYHDFNVMQIFEKDFQNVAGKRKYIIKGTSIPKFNGIKYHTMINQHLNYDKNINLLCADTYNYGNVNFPKEYAEIVVVERELKNDGGIIGGAGVNIRIKLRLMTRVVISSADDTGKITYTPLMDNTGKPRMKVSYVGICPNTSCKHANGKTYPRICLYDDILDPNVLEFEPIQVI